MTWTVLHAAAQTLDSKCIFERCKTSTNELKEHDDHGSTPLHIIAWGNPDLQHLEALISCCPAALVDKDVHGNTCLHISCSFPGTDVSVVQAFLDANPVLASMANKEGLMPLHVACRLAPENEAVIVYLAEAYPSALRKPIKMGNPAPRRRSNTTKKKATDHFVSRDAGTNVSAIEVRFQSLSHQIRDGAYPLHMAIQSGAPRSVLAKLIQTAAAAAAAAAAADIANDDDDGTDTVLLQTNKFGQTPLTVALIRSISGTTMDDDVFHLLLGEQSKIKAILVQTKDEVHDNLPIHVAAIHHKCCSVHVIKTLLRIFPSSVQEQNKDGKTPHDLAVETGTCPEATLELLKSKTQVAYV